MFMLDLGSQAGKAIDAARKVLKENPSLPAAVTTVLTSTENWHPVIRGRKILTPALRKKLADALAHLAMNMNLADAGKDPL